RVIAAAVGDEVHAEVRDVRPCERHDPEAVAVEALEQRTRGDVVHLRVVAQVAPRWLWQHGAAAEMAAGGDAGPVGRPGERHAATRERDRALEGEVAIDLRARGNGDDERENGGNDHDHHANPHTRAHLEVTSSGRKWIRSLPDEKGATASRRASESRA